MTVEEILAALQAIIDGAQADDGQPRDLTEEEAARYEQLEQQLAVARRSAEIKQRNSAYNTPAPGQLTVAAPRPDNTLERAFDAYLRTGQANQDITQLRAQSEGASTAGGYLVPPGFRDKLVEVMKAYGGLAAEVDGFSTATGNALEYPTIDDTANLGDITAESATFADGADLVFGTVNLGSYKYTSAGAGSGLPLRVSVELLQDAAFDVQGLVTRFLGTRIARKQAAHWCTGTGVGQPQGLVGNVTADETLDVSNVVDYDDLTDLEGVLDPEYEQNAKWVMNKASWVQIRQIVDTTGRPLLQQQAEAGIGGRPEKTLLGYPVVIDQQMPALTTATSRFAVLGDLREAYTIRRVRDLVINVNPYNRQHQGEIEFSGWERADGAIQNRSAYVVLRNV